MHFNFLLVHNLKIGRLKSLEEIIVLEQHASVMINHILSVNVINHILSVNNHSTYLWPKKLLFLNDPLILKTTNQFKKLKEGGIDNKGGKFINPSGRKEV